MNLKLTLKQQSAIKRLVKAKKDIEKSGLQLMMIDNNLCLYKKSDNVQFETVNELESFTVTDFGNVQCFGM